ncbi:MAG: YlxR family protein [candidate division KSB1 bacterium]|nr:YlxR family protein [candidate division KSB1 bacterium]MDZ7274521.1 YlxR family protein [candidate division KSB1 bacterium]MDZ7284818.1 YlxR family protein [candidate division KSB1 bacterium]MDZ7297762.1 YlxR family protein [candidate division KSB1 bacterium]MDZ7308693.1 YlxR family protein [candidate division KSB1 bacterium]
MSVWADPAAQASTPQRTCLACGRKRAKAALLRISLQSSGHFVIDPRQKLPGRGAYLCPTVACAELLLRRKGLHHGFRREVPPAIYQQVIAFVRQMAATTD